ncbi:MAG: hypothetical protein WD850_02215 [Candidatus Spechtbacterales bacterium]
MASFLLIATILVAIGGILYIMYRRRPGALSMGTFFSSVRVPHIRMFRIVSLLTTLRKWFQQQFSATKKLIRTPSKVERPFIKESVRHELKGTDLRALRPSTETEEFWIRLIQSNPRNAYLYKRLGEFYLRSRKTKYALETFKHAQKLAPQDESINKYIGQIEHEPERIVR